MKNIILDPNLNVKFPGYRKINLKSETAISFPEPEGPEYVSL